VSVRVLDDAGNEFGRATFKEDAGNLTGLSENLSQQAALQIRKRIGEEVQVSQTRASTNNAEAWALFQRAQGARRRADSVLVVDGTTATFYGQYRAADSLAAAAERQDSRWVDPIVLRATLAYWLSRRTVDDSLVFSVAMIDSGLSHANRALALQSDSPDALEMRGNLNYWRWLLGLEPNSALAAELLQSARADLESATRINPSQASAWAMLSHMYANLADKSLSDVILAANKALEFDAFLSNADVIINRLAHAYYDEGNFSSSDRWCAEGHRRFPTQWQFYECQLLLMTSNLKQPDPVRAWALADTIVQLTQDRYQFLNSQVLVAGVLARAGQMDSARSILRRTRDDPVADTSRDLANTSAFIWLLAGDTTAAVGRIKDYLIANPGRRRDFAENPNWWFSGIQNDPRYREAVGGGR
jgi:serine/threonine-protein kinase